MMKVHIVTQGKYGDKEIIGVVSDPAKVSPGILEQLDVEIQDYELDSLLVLETGESPWEVIYDETGESTDAWIAPISEFLDPGPPEWDNHTRHLRRVIACSEPEAIVKATVRFETEGLVS